jgi:hypothetical protein
MPFVSVSSLSHLNGRCKMSSTCTAIQEHPKWIQMQLLLECLTQVQSLPPPPPHFFVGQLEMWRSQVH